MTNKFIISALIFICTFSCTHRQSLQPEQYIKALKEISNELKFSFNHNNYIFSFDYRPSDLFLAEQLQNSVQNKNTLMSKYNGLHYFILTITPNFKDSLITSGLKDYVFQKMESEITLIVEGQTVFPSIYTVENLGNSDDSARVFIGFETQMHDINKCQIQFKESYFKQAQFSINIPTSKLPILKI
jgi:hypothetical protein